MEKELLTSVYWISQGRSWIVCVCTDIRMSCVSFGAHKGNGPAQPLYVRCSLLNALWCTGPSLEPALVYDFCLLWKEGVTDDAFPPSLLHPLLWRFSLFGCIYLSVVPT